MQDTRLRYAIKFVADMEKAVKFYHDVLGLEVKFESPGWSEFVAGETTLELQPAGKVELGFTVADVDVFYRDMSAKGVLFSLASRKQDFGGLLAIPKAHIAVWAQRRHERSFSTTVDKSLGLYRQCSDISLLGCED